MMIMFVGNKSIILYRMLDMKKQFRKLFKFITGLFKRKLENKDELIVKQQCVSFFIVLYIF